MVFQEKLLLSKWNFPRLIVLMKKARVGVFFQGLQQSRHRRRVFYPFLLASSEGAGIRQYQEWWVLFDTQCILRGCILQFLEQHSFTMLVQESSKTLHTRKPVLLATKGFPFSFKLFEQSSFAAQAPSNWIRKNRNSCMTTSCYPSTVGMMMMIVWSFKTTLAPYSKSLKNFPFLNKSSFSQLPFKIDVLFCRYSYLAMWNFYDETRAYIARTVNLLPTKIKAFFYQNCSSFIDIWSLKIQWVEVQF